MEEELERIKIEEKLKRIDVAEPKYSYCIVKYNELYLKEFTLYPRVDVENNEVEFKVDVIFTSDYNQANKFKISDAHYITEYLREGTILKYIY